MSVPQESNDLERLFQLLRERKEAEFVESDNIRQYANEKIENQSLLHCATNSGLPEAVKKLLNEGAIQTPNAIFDLPVEIAGRCGFYKVFEVFLKNDRQTKVPDRLLIHLLKYADEKGSEDVNHNKCLEIWFQERDDIDVNVQSEGIEDTPLHCATRYGKPEQVQLLLERGASLISKNTYGELPIETIDPNTLEAYFSNCLILDKSEDENRKDFTVTYNYKGLVPQGRPKTSTTTTTGSAEEEGLTGKKLESFNLETQVVYCMSESSELKHLLAHPLITSFLDMKWKRICWFYYINLAFYIYFFSSLILHILFVYNNNNPHIIVVVLLSINLFISWKALIFREIFQVVVSYNYKSYIFNVENVLELLLILSTVFVLFQISPFNDSKKQIAAFVILIAGIELVLLLELLPLVSLYIVMLRTVSLTFFKYLSVFCILILTFSLSFYTLFSKIDLPSVESEQNNLSSANKNDADTICCNNKEEGTNFFLHPLTAIFKTFVMLAGEFETTSIEFHNYPYVSYVLFMLFVFIIPIILLNLLNGLAVCETNIIKSNAEIEALMVRIRHIAYFEKIFIMNDSSVCFYNLRRKIAKEIISRVCIFPYYLKNYQLKICANQKAQFLCTNMVYGDSENHTCTTQCPLIELGKLTAKRTRQIIKTRLERSKKEKEKQNASIKLEQQQRYIEELTKEHQIILNRLNRIIIKCTKLERAVRRHCKK